MLSARLPRSDATTSAVGFGCAYLTGGLESTRNVAMIHRALEAGITHFDVAPSYGIGTAEEVLGAALAGRRARVTLASKIGQPRPRLTLRRQILRLAATPVRRGAAPLLRALERTHPRVPVPWTPNPLFTPAGAEQSLQETLKRLRTDYLDLLLLHEARIQDISDELLDFLQARRAAGTIRAVGIASERGVALEIARRSPGFFDVIQCSWSPLMPALAEDPDVQGVFRVTHRTLMYALVPLSEWLRADPRAAQRLSEATGADLRSGETLSRVLLGAALARHAGIVLAGTRRMKRIEANAAAATEQTVSAGRSFLAALAREPGRPLQPAAPTLP